MAPQTPRESAIDWAQLQSALARQPVVLHRLLPSPFTALVNYLCYVCYLLLEGKLLKDLVPTRGKSYHILSVIYELSTYSIFDIS